MTHLKLIAATLFGLLLFTPMTIAQDMDSKSHGPAVGTILDMDFSAPDQNGQPQSFDTFKGDKGAVVVFFRSAKWCPFCQMQLIDLNTNALKGISERGYGLVGISYDDPTALKRFTQKWKVGFPLLSDKGSEMIDALGIRNEEYKEGHYAHGVPHPVIFVLDNDKKIIAKLSRESYRERPEPAVILETLDKIS